MKKVITICLLVVTLLVGGMTIDAKTSKKRSKASSTKVDPKANTVTWNLYNGYMRIENHHPFRVRVHYTIYDYNDNAMYNRKDVLLGNHAFINPNSFVNVSFKTDNSRYNRYSGEVDQIVRL